MQISGNVSSYIGNSPLQGRDPNRPDEALERARKQKQDQPPSQEQSVNISDAARQAAQQQQVIPSNASQANQNDYQYYPTDQREGLTSSQRRALQAYDSNQQLSREADATGEFLSGGIDLFV